MFEYNYELSTKKQKQHIDLIQFKASLQTTIKNFFADKELIDLIVKTDGYVLTLKHEFNNAKKRALGKNIAKIDGLKTNVNEFIYNNGTGRSGQLFRLKNSRQI